MQQAICRLDNEQRYATLTLDFLGCVQYPKLNYLLVVIVRVKATLTIFRNNRTSARGTA